MALTEEAIMGIADEMDDICSHLPAALIGNETLAKIAEWRDRLVVACCADCPQAARG